MNEITKQRIDKANASLVITTLIENTVSQMGLVAEHGLSFWIEYNGKNILFDTGQTDNLIHNAKALGIDLADTDAIVLSHGHYDHTGGLASVLPIAKKAEIYTHPAIGPKFSSKKSGIKSIGIPEPAMTAIQKRKIIRTEKPTTIFPGLKVTGEIPRINDFEHVDDNFYLDETCHVADKLPDDQSLFIETENGLVIVFGCAHAGAVNILHRIADLSQKKTFYAIMGGMHLLHASRDRVERTETVFREYNLQKIGPMHCTGEEATRSFWNNFPDKCFSSHVGTKVIF